MINDLETWLSPFSVLPIPHAWQCEICHICVSPCPFKTVWTASQTLQLLSSGCMQSITVISSLYTQLTFFSIPILSNNCMIDWWVFIVVRLSSRHCGCSTCLIVCQSLLLSFFFGGGAKIRDADWGALPTQHPVSEDTGAVNMPWNRDRTILVRLFLNQIICENSL